MTLFSLGWSDSFDANFAPFAAAGLVPARVALQHKNAYEVLTPQGLMAAGCTGKLVHLAACPADLPAVGDWVAVRVRANEPQADIHAVLPRATKFSRRAPGSGVEQIIATNIDTVFLVTALDQNYNLRRIERYLTVARESGATPVIVLNKADLAADPDAQRAQVAAISADTPVVSLSAFAPSVADRLAAWLQPGATVALLGSSGVGKSTLINALLGSARQSTGSISDAVGKGRHTTTHRELIVAPAGFLVVDTPGMRELQLWDTDEASVDETFSDIAALTRACRFTDCSHTAEPGCAIQAALEDGTLDIARWQSFQKLRREQAYAARKSDARLARESKAHWKKLNRNLRSTLRFKQRDE